MPRLHVLAGLLLFFAPAYLLGWAAAAVRRGWAAGRADLDRTAGGGG
jgi:hypothetical protein